MAMIPLELKTFHFYRPEFIGNQWVGDLALFVKIPKLTGTIAPQFESHVAELIHNMHPGQSYTGYFGREILLVRKLLF